MKITDLLNHQESPPPEPHRPLPAPMPVAHTMGPSPRPLAGTPYHPVAVAPAPGPGPSHYTQQFQIAPRQVPLPGQHGQVHIQPQPMSMHSQQHHGMPQMQPLQPLQPMQPLHNMQPMPATQQFQVHPYQPPHQAHFTPQPQAPQQMHYQSPAHLAPAHESPFRPVHPAPIMAPRPQPVAPAPPSAPMPHHNGNQPLYNPPRAPEVYTLNEVTNNAIPEEIRASFSNDEQGRVLFFTAPPTLRPNNGVAEQYAGLGHSAKHMASIQEVRAERAAKRKARDDLAALEEAANRKRRAMQRDMEVKKELKRYEELGKQWLIDFVDDMTAGTEYIKAHAPGTREEGNAYEAQLAAEEERKKAEAGEKIGWGGEKTVEAAAVPGAEKV